MWHECVSLFVLELCNCFLMECFRYLEADVKISSERVFEAENPVVLQQYFFDCHLPKQTLTLISVPASPFAL